LTNASIAFAAPAVSKVFEQCVLSTSRASLPFFDALGQALADKSALSVLVAGGSETAGIDCVQGNLKQASCAWSARYASLLGELFPGKTFYVHNQASGGSTMSVGLLMVGSWLQDFQPDILLVDYIVNDCFEAQESKTASLVGLYEAFVRKVQILGYGNRCDPHQQQPALSCLEHRDICSQDCIRKHHTFCKVCKGAELDCSSVFNARHAAL
jgi:hypothetical protein